MAQITTSLTALAQTTILITAQRQKKTALQKAITAGNPYSAIIGLPATGKTTLVSMIEICLLGGVAEAANAQSTSIARKIGRPAIDVYDTVGETFKAFSFSSLQHNPEYISQLNTAFNAQTLLISPTDIQKLITESESAKKEAEEKKKTDSTVTIPSVITKQAAREILLKEKITALAHSKATSEAFANFIRSAKYLYFVVSLAGANRAYDETNEEISHLQVEYPHIETNIKAIIKALYEIDKSHQPSAVFKDFLESKQNKEIIFLVTSADLAFNKKTYTNAPDGGFFYSDKASHLTLDEYKNGKEEKLTKGLDEYLQWYYEDTQPKSHEFNVGRGQKTITYNTRTDFNFKENFINTTVGIVYIAYPPSFAYQYDLDNHGEYDVGFEPVHIGLAIEQTPEYNEVFSSFKKTMCEALKLDEFSPDIKNAAKRETTQTIKATLNHVAECIGNALDDANNRKHNTLASVTILTALKTALQQDITQGTTDVLTALNNTISHTEQLVQQNTQDLSLSFEGCLTLLNTLQDILSNIDNNNGSNLPDCKGKDALFQALIDTELDIKQHKENTEQEIKRQKNILLAEMQKAFVTIKDALKNDLNTNNTLEREFASYKAVISLHSGFDDCDITKHKQAILTNLQAFINILETWITWCQNIKSLKEKKASLSKHLVFFKALELKISNIDINNPTTFINKLFLDKQRFDDLCKRTNKNNELVTENGNPISLSCLLILTSLENTKINDEKQAAQKIIDDAAEQKRITEEAATQQTLEAQRRTEAEKNEAAKLKNIQAHQQALLSLINNPPTTSETWHYDVDYKAIKDIIIKALNTLVNPSTSDFRLLRKPLTIECQPLLLLSWLDSIALAQVGKGHESYTLRYIDDFKKLNEEGKKTLKNAVMPTDISTTSFGKYIEHSKIDASSKI